MLMINKPATMIKAVKLHKNTNRYTKPNINQLYISLNIFLTISLIHINDQLQDYKFSYHF